MQIFVSHSDKDRHVYDELAELLWAAGVGCWDPKTMPPGLQLPDELQKAIASCDACIFVATPYSVSSGWCLAELGAFWGAGMPVIPYVADSALDMTKLPPYLKGTLWTTEAAVATNRARDEAARWRRVHPLARFDTAPADVAALVRLTAIIDAHSDQVRAAKILQYSGDYVRPIIQKLNALDAQVQLLLAHPAQLLASPHFPVRAQQFDKMKAFTAFLEEDANLHQIQRRYYLPPASLRGVAIPGVLCALGWYTHQKHWLYGHDNATIVVHGRDVEKTAVWATFDRVFDEMWSQAIAYEDDRANLTRLLHRPPPEPGSVLALPGIVIPGYGVASGTGGSQGFLEQQAEGLGKFIDWQRFWKGTINVSIAPKAFVWRDRTATAPNLRWSQDQPAEDFCLAPTRIEVGGVRRDAWVYYPHPRTKAQNFHSPSVVEIIAPWIESVRYGSSVTVELDTAKFVIW